MPPLELISNREIEIIKLISQEYTTQEIAKVLYISKSTVETHRSNILGKLKVKNSAGIVRKGFELGLIAI